MFQSISIEQIVIECRQHCVNHIHMLHVDTSIYLLLVREQSQIKGIYLIKF